MNRLRELREDRDMTLAELGAVIGATGTTIARYELGKRALTDETIGKFCGFFGVTSDYLLGRSPWKTPVVSELDTELVTAYHTAPAEIRAIVDAALAPYKANQSAGSAAS